MSMNKKRSAFIVLILALMMVVSVFGQPTDANNVENGVDMYFENGVIYTADSQDSIVEAMAIKDGKIAFVGSMADGASYKKSAAKVVDLEGKMLMPGMIDSHVHSDSLDGFDINLMQAHDMDAVKTAIKDAMEKYPDQEAYCGFGLQLMIFDGIEKVQGPRKELLDEICPDKPVLIYGGDGHTAWLNTKAFELLNITTETKPPRGGVIPKNEKGELWGTLQDAAMALCSPFPRDAQRIQDGLKSHMELLNSMGMTSMMTPSGNGFLLVSVDAYQKLDDAGELTMRVRYAPIITEWGMETDLKKLAEYKAMAGSELLKVNGAKFFLDGVMENQTALLLEPYSDRPDHYGDAGWDQEKLNQATSSVIELGLPVHFHAMADGAVRMGLDAIEQGLKEVAPENSRNALTHVELVHKDDYKRMADLNVTAVANPFWHMGGQPPQVATGLGEERMNTLFPMKSFVDNGVRLIFASDYPATSNPSPFKAIEMGITRNACGEVNGKPIITDMDDPKYLLNAHERVDLRQMLRGYTIDAAYAIYSEDVTGSLEVGKFADFIIIDQNLFETKPLDIHKTQVLNTYLQGTEVYSK